MKIWALLSNVDDIIEAHGEGAFKRGGGAFDFLLIDYVSIEIINGAQPRVYYKGEPVALPDAFWPMISNTDSFLLEKLLLTAGVPCLLNLDEVAVARSKAATYRRLAANGIRIPASVVFFKHPDRAVILDRMKYPFVVKPDNGFGGEGVKLISCEAELDEYLSKLDSGIVYIAQEYIAASRGRDARVILLDGEYLYSATRSATNPNEFRSNVHVGGKLQEYSIDDEVLGFCKKIAALFDLPLIGLDLLFGDGEFVVAEINAFPGLFPENMAKAANTIIGKFLAKNGGN